MIRDGEHSVTVIAEAHGKVISEFQKKTLFQPPAETRIGALKDASRNGKYINCQCSTSPCICFYCSPEFSI